MQTLNIAVIGCGDIARKSYLPGLHAPERGVFVVAVCDIIAERARVAQRDLAPDARVYTDYRAMLADTNADLVLVLTPVATHAPFVSDALNAGKNVYSEKPLALTADRATELCDLAESLGLTLMAAPLLMLYPEYQWLRETIRGGVLGQRPTFARAHSSHGGANRGMWNSDSGNFFRADTAGATPPLYDMGVYALTILTNCLGSVRRVTAFSGISEKSRRIDKVNLPDFVPYTLDATVPDNAGLLLDFGDGAFATLDASFCLPYKKGPAYEFYGYAGAATFDGGPDALEIISENPAFAAPDAAKPTQWHPHPVPAARRLPAPLKWGQILARHVQECRETGRAPLCPARHALHVVDIMEAAQTAAATGAAQTLRTVAAPTL